MSVRRENMPKNARNERKMDKIIEKNNIQTNKRK